MHLRMRTSALVRLQLKSKMERSARACEFPADFEQTPFLPLHFTGQPTHYLLLPWASLRAKLSLRLLKEPAGRLRTMGKIILFRCFPNGRCVCHTNWATKTNIDQFINSIRRLWACIPLKTRRSIGRLPDKGPGSSRKMRKAPNMSTITFPQAFTAKLDLWEDNPFLFFKDDSSISLELGRNPLAGSYNYMSRLKQRTETDTMRLRFWKVVYHRLKERLCLNRLRIDNVEIVTRVISRSGMAEDELDLIRRRVSRWTDEGRRIDTLCRDISRAKSLDNAHLGILFCLPDDISDEL